MEYEQSRDNLVNGMLPNGLTVNEEEKVKVAFKAFDKDCSGLIDAEELISVF